MSFSYKLDSCDPEAYPDIDNLCATSRHALEGLVVYVDEVFLGQPIDYLKTYTLVYLGEDAEVCNNWLPQLGANFENSCASNYEYLLYKNCTTGILQAFAFESTFIQPAVFRQDGSCECWQYQSEDISTPPILAGSFTAYDNCLSCQTDLANGICPTGERGLSYAVRTQLPKTQAPDRGFKSCCYNNIALASRTDSSGYKNDFYGSYFQRQIPNSTVLFYLVNLDTLVEYPLVDDTYGVYQGFGGTQSDLSFYIIEWQKVLLLLDAGNYQIKQVANIAGIAIEYLSNSFNLKEFSIDNADKTVRIDCVQDGLLLKSGVNFEGTNFRTSLRVRGFFGRPTHTYEKDYLTTQDYDSRQITMSYEREYLFQGVNLPICITEELLEFVVLGNIITISDYNKNNHSYEYELIDVELQNNDNTEYFTLKREVNINLTFIDRYKNLKKINC